MLRKSSIRRVAAFLACLGCCMPHDLMANNNAASSSEVRAGSFAVDLQLQHGGLLVGKTMAASGATPAKAKSKVLLKQGKATIASTLTDEHGRFAFRGLRGGTYEVEMDDYSLLTRCWAEGTAPPHALAELDCNQVITIRGQAHPLAAGLANPWVIAGIAVAAIAIPIAINEHRNDRTAD